VAVNREIVLAYLDQEIPAAIAWAEDKRLTYEWDRDDLSFSLRLEGRSENDGQIVIEPYLLVGSFHDYRVEPPTWRFLDPRTRAAIGPAAYPLGAWPTGSIFHGNGLVCAAWSRDAYHDRGGPHNDWGDGTAWQTAAPQHVQAATIPDMLARIYAELQLSPGRMAPLPDINQAAA
jgi:hypothetical protein